MSDEPLTKNFVGECYREASVNLAQYGRTGFRKAILGAGDGLTMLETKGGMPRVTRLQKLPCKDDVGPLTETSYDDREMYDEADYPRKFSLDGIYSAPRNKTKSILVTTPAAKTLRIHVAGFNEPAIGPNGDLVETRRTLSDHTAHVVSHNVEKTISFVGKTLEHVYFQRKSCKRPLAELDLCCGPPATGVDGDTDGTLFGGYVQSAETVLPEGDAQIISDVTFTDRSLGRKLVINFSKPGGLLEYFGGEAAGTMAKIPLFSPEAPDVTIWYPPYENFASTFKGFFTPLGIYTDETMAVEIPLSEGGWEDDDIPSGEAAVSADSAPRYFNFASDSEEVSAGDSSPVKLKSDVQFNKGRSAALNSVELGDDQHLYKDPDGVVWLITFSMSVNGLNVASVTVKLTRRFDPIFEPTLTKAINRVLGTIVVANQTYPLAPNPEYDSLSRSPPALLTVASLPNGLEAACHLLFGAGERCTDQLSGLTCNPVTTGIVRAAFSGSGGETGAGVGVSLGEVAIWRAWNTTPGVYKPAQPWERGDSPSGTHWSGVYNPETIEDWNPATSLDEFWPYSKTLTTRYRACVLRLLPQRNNTWDELTGEFSASGAAEDGPGFGSMTGSASAPDGTIIGEQYGQYSSRGKIALTFKSMKGSSELRCSSNYIYVQSQVLKAGDGSAWLNVDYRTEQTLVLGTTVVKLPDSNYGSYGIPFVPLPFSVRSSPLRYDATAGISSVVLPGGLATPRTVLWGGYPVDRNVPENLRCLDPRNDRLYVAPEPGCAGLFF